MANLCDCVYKCIGEEKELQSLYEVLEDLKKGNITPTEGVDNKWWLGHLVTKLGGDWKEYSCRGEIVDFKLEAGVLTLEQSTAWAEQEGVRRIIEEAFPSIKVFFREEEAGCEVYRTNDASGKYFPDRYIISTEEEWECFSTIEEAAKYVSEILGEQVAPSAEEVEKALEAYSLTCNEDDTNINFYAVEVVE